MRIDIDVTMDYQLGDDPTVLLTLEAAQSAGQSVVEDHLEIAGARMTLIDGEAGVGQRVWAHVDSDRMRLRYRATVDVTRPPVALETLSASPLHALPAEALTFIRPSRYCQSDMFSAFVERRFADTEGGAKIAAIRDWVQSEMTYAPESSGPATTVLDTFATREGVCRDYAHMVCALARAANIPARYASVYGPGVTPADFHAVAQVWLDGGWHMVDGSGMCAADELVMIAVGRDACDTAFMETSAPAQFVEQSVRVSRV